MKPLISRLRRALERNASTIPLSARRVVAPMIDESAEELAYWRMAARGFEPGGIIDVGAYQGDWSRKVGRIFPDAPIVMVEAQSGKLKHLERVGRHTTPVIAVLADVAGRELTFYEMETGSSLLAEFGDAPRTERKVTTRTLDQVAEEHIPHAEPLLVKLDVQGAEMMILEGGARTLDRTGLLQLELPLVAYNEGAPGLVDILRWLGDRGFAPVDLAGAHRPDGLRTVQIDMLFARSAHFASRS